MARRKNERPTTIYWIYDMRPETVVSWPGGLPFYCGKTVQKPEYRLRAHGKTMALHPARPIAILLRQCSEYVRIGAMEIVPACVDWAERERHWIRVIRWVNPSAVNVADGGEGAPGNIPSASHRAKMSAIMMGRTVSAETRARMSERMKGTSIRKGKLASPEVRAAFSAMRKGKKRWPHTEETKIKMSASQKGRPVSDDRRARLRSAWVRRKARMRVDSTQVCG